MSPRIPLLLAGLSLSSTLLAQDLLFYKFESNCGSRVVNYAAGSPAPNEGVITTNLPGAPASSWIPGQYGSALKGGSVVAPATHNFVDTGWVPGTVTGSMTWACWLRMDPAAPTPSLTYVFGNGSSFRVFTGGGGFFLTSGWGGGNVNTVANIQTLARAGWVHLACVLDGTALTGTYYINGVPEAPLAITPVNWTGTQFFVGKYSGLTNANIFDLDEFLLTNRALSAAEVAVLAASPYAADGRFGSTCGPTLAGNGQRPSLGNAAYGLDVTGPLAGLAWVVFGTGRCTIFGGTTPLPIDLGLFTPSLAGCQGHVDTDLGALTGVLQSGAASFAFPMPAWPGLSGWTFYAEAVTFDGVSTQLRSSNALAISVGQ